MELNFVFFINSILLGIGLAADAFSVSLANGLHEPCMRRRKIFATAGTFGIMQGLMPLIGWFCVHTAVEHFKGFQPFIPWIALILLCFLGVKMILDARQEEAAVCKATPVSISGLLMQGIATSIDALSVGFTIANYNTVMALISSAIIGVITFGLCLVGLYIGRIAGDKFSGKAGILGGTILIFIGLEIFITNLLGI